MNGDYHRHRDQMGWTAPGQIPFSSHLRTTFSPAQLPTSVVMIPRGKKKSHQSVDYHQTNRIAASRPVRSSLLLSLPPLFSYFCRSLLPPSCHRLGRLNPAECDPHYQAVSACLSSPLVQRPTSCLLLSVLHSEPTRSRGTRESCSREPARPGVHPPCPAHTAFHAPRHPTM